ncbi:MAG: DUF3352 domain-containing protein [Alkalinema sp. CAN_BIN05]|nr:DUF3352 domain-containing protein [Alkalinema sp. CAN_BIN05]
MTTRLAASILLGSLITPIAATLSLIGIASAETIARPIEFPAVSQLLPDSIVGVVFVNPEPQLWQDLTKFKTFPQDFTTPGPMFSNLGSGLNYHGDIAPWISGPVGTVIMLNPEQTKTTYATVAPVKDPTQMPRFFDRIKRSRDKLPTTRLYNGTSILFWESEKVPNFLFKILKSSQEKQEPVKTDASVKTTAPIVKDRPAAIETLTQPQKTIEIGGFAAAYLKSGFVITSESISAIQQIIDAEASPDRRLSSVPGYQRMISDDRYPKALISGYANLGNLIKSNQLSTPSPFKELNNFPLFQSQTPEQLSQLINSGSDGIDGFVWAAPEGIQAQIGIHFKSPIPDSFIQTVNSPNALISRVPAVNYGISGSTNLAFFWRALTTVLETNPTTKQGLKSFRDGSQSVVGIDDRDIFPWMDKEYIGFAFPSQGSALKQLDPKLAIGFGAFFQTSDRPAATAAFKKVETALIKLSNGEFKVATRTIGNTTLTSWEVVSPTKLNKLTPNKSTPPTPKPVSFFAYQWTTQDTLAILSGADTANNLLPKPWQPLDQAKHFQDAIAPLPKQNMGYAYLNPPALLALGNQLGLTKILQPKNTKDNPELDLSTTISTIFSIAATSALQPTQLTSESYVKLATRPIPKLTAQQFIDRANVQAETYDGDWAIANFTRALSLEPNNADAYYGRATAQTTAENYLGAIEDLDRTIQLEPKKVNAYLDRSKSKQQTYDYLGSLTDATNAIDLTTKPELKSDAYYLRSVAQFNQGSYTEALNDLKQSITLNPYRDSASFLCSIEARSGNPDALETCSQSVNDPSEGGEIKEPTAELSAHLCLARAQKKDPKAFQDCGKAITKDPENPIPHEVQGLARLAAGDRKGAIFSLEKALKLYTVLGDRTAIDRVQAAINQNQ